MSWYFVVLQENDILHEKSDIKHHNIVNEYIPLCTSEALNSCGMETSGEMSSVSSNDSELHHKSKKVFFKKFNIALKRIFSSKL